jgi:hypothetical protein
MGRVRSHRNQRRYNPVITIEIRIPSSGRTTLQFEIRRRSPRYTAVMQPQPLEAVDIQQSVLDGDTVLLETGLGEERSWLWAVTRQTISSVELPPRGRSTPRPAAAVRAAQLAMASDPRWSAPYYWAGFVMQGDWK